jgi:hypothetical protein
MKKSFTLHKTALLAACGALLQLSAQAQSSNDSALVEITGQISPTTCILNMADTAGGTNTATNKTIDFGNTKTASTGITAGSVFGTAKKVVFSLGSASNPALPCTAGAGNTGWNVILGFAPGSVTTLGTKTFVKNQTTGGTDALVALSDATGATPTPLTLKETMGYAGTTVTATNQGFAKTITLQAQLAYAAAAAATPGAFTATIPLLVLYK